MESRKDEKLQRKDSPSLKNNEHSVDGAPHDTNENAESVNEYLGGGASLKFSFGGAGTHSSGMSGTVSNKVTGSTSSSSSIINTPNNFIDPNELKKPENLKANTNPKNSSNAYSSSSFTYGQHGDGTGKAKKPGHLDYENMQKYSAYTHRWGVKKDDSVTANSDSISFSANENVSAGNDNLSNATRKDVEGIIWKSINNRLIEFSRELIESKKNISESRKGITRIMTAVSQQKNRIEGFDTSLSEAEKKLEMKVKEFETEVVTARNSLLAVIALFASFFTFISISVNVFSRDMSLATSVSVLLVIWSCLISFIFIFMAGISKGGSYFTSSAFFKHAIFMVVLFFGSFVFPRVIFTFFPIN
ncbi:hypothetical protein D3C72_319380 [compost metagenome]